jgi:hypothetical protein
LAGASCGCGRSRAAPSAAEASRRTGGEIPLQLPGAGAVRAR